MEHIGTLPETNDILSPTIVPLFGILNPPGQKEEECHFCMEKITKGQCLVFKLPCCGHYTHTECFKTWALLSHKERQQCAAPTVEQHIHTRRMLPLLTRIQRKTQLYNSAVLRHGSQC